MPAKPPSLRRKSNLDVGETIGAIAAVCAVLAVMSVPFVFVAAWITHVIVCIKTSAWILLLFGCIVFPIGIIHGIAVWFGIL